jgi:glycerol dehydrogenase
LERLLPAPDRFVIGAGTLDVLGRCLVPLGKRVFVVGGKTALSKTESRIMRILQASGLQIAGVEGNVRECTHKEIDRIVETAKPMHPDVCLGVGGGVASDTTKAVAFKLGTPIALAPTLCTTNAESSGCSIIYNEDHKFLEALTFPRSPDLVVVDTKLIVEIAGSTLSVGMGDALSAKFEAEACHASHSRNVHGGFGTSLSLAAAQVCFEKLMMYGIEAKLAAEKGLLTNGVEEVIEAVKLLSGFAWEGSGTAAAHAMHTGLTYVDSIAPPRNLHGQIVAFSTIAQLLLERRRQDEIKRIIEWCNKVGLPVTIEQLGGADEKQLQRAAEKACGPYTGMVNMPFEVTPKMVYDSFTMADELGMMYLKGKL